MKRRIFALVGIVLMLALTACAAASEGTVPGDVHDLVYDLTEYGSFGDIFDTKSPGEWDGMGAYTVLLNGLDTPVLVDMNGRDVLAVRAYGQTAQLGADGGLFQDSTPVSISSIEGAVLVNVSRDYDGKTFLLTEEKCQSFQPEGDISTQIFAREDGTLTYRRYWGEYETSFEQWETAPLDLCTSRDQFLYEAGHAQIRDGEVVLTAEETVTVSDLYDLDAMFAEAKAQRQYEEYETADDLLAANAA